MGGMPLAIKANNSKADHLELLARITGELDDRPEVVINIQQSAEYIAVRNVIFAELEDYPEVRANISKRLRVLATTGTDPGPS